MTSFAGVDRASLKINIAHLRKVLGDKEIGTAITASSGIEPQRRKPRRTPSEVIIESFAMVPTPGLEPGRGFRPYGF